MLDEDRKTLSKWLENRGDGLTHLMVGPSDIASATREECEALLRMLRSDYPHFYRLGDPTASLEEHIRKRIAALVPQSQPDVLDTLERLTQGPDKHLALVLERACAEIQRLRAKCGE